MAVKLFTIGDSISQGFMSGAAAKTDQSYSTLLADILNAAGYHYPEWPHGGHPVDLEMVFRRLQHKLGANIAFPIEWVRAFIIIKNYLDEVEDYYERGPGSVDNCAGNKPFHNVAVRGFNVSDAWQLTADLCKYYIDNTDQDGDNFYGLVSESFHRTGYTVLASGADDSENELTQLGWLRHHHQREGVENVALWLGANNALGTVVNLTINPSSDDGNAFPHGVDAVSYSQRQDWNLWHPEDFRAEYKFMLDKVVAIMEDNPHDTDYKVFIATIPLVTICPLIKAVEKAGREDIEVEEWPVDQSNPAPASVDELRKGTKKMVSYGKYYPYFVFEDSFDHNVKHLNRDDVLKIDNYIRKYNRIIQELVAEANATVGSKRFYLVDISDALSSMAIKRNKSNPDYDYPEYFKYVIPSVNPKYYGVTRDGTIKAGGLFSLDGVHPTAIGQGLIAWEFLKVMEKAGSFNGNVNSALNWKEIFASDTLRSKPIGLLGEIYDNINLKEWVYKMMTRSWEQKKY